MNKVIQKAKSVLDMRTLVSLDKQRTVRNYVTGSCPFHEDNNPSFIVYKDGWHCYSAKCPRPQGSVLDWIAHLRGNDNPTGKDIYELAKEFGGSGSKRSIIVLPGTHHSKPVKKIRQNPDFSYRSPVQHHLKYLIDRGFSEEFVEFYKLGSKNNSVAIPIWSGLPRVSKLKGVRFRNLNNYGPRYYGIEGYNEPMLVNSWVIKWLQQDQKRYSRYLPLHVFYGEFDALLACQLGIPAVSPTNGCKSFDPMWVRNLDMPIVFYPDLGEESAAIADAQAIGFRASVKPFAYFEGKDFTEIYLSATKKARQERDDWPIRKFMSQFAGVPELIKFWKSRRIYED